MSAAAKRQRADINDALIADLRRQIETLEGENAALRSARRLYAADEDPNGLKAENKRLRVARRKLDDELRVMKSSIVGALTNIATVGVATAILDIGSDLLPSICVMIAVEEAANELGVELKL